MISFVIQSFDSGNCFLASYAICTARSTPQQNPYASASLNVIPSRTYANPFSFIVATSPVFEYEIPSFAIFVAASSSFKNLRLY